jgi:MFS family permease
MSKESTPEDTASSLVEKSAEVSLEAQPGEKPIGEITFLEGGVRAWLVVLGASGVLSVPWATPTHLGRFESAKNDRRLNLLTNCSVYQEYYQAHQLSDQAPSAISWIGSLQVFFVLGASLVGGPLFDRYGEKVCSHSIRCIDLFTNRTSTPGR